VLTAKEIRNGFIDFFKGKDHEFVPSSPIVPIGDETLLFANAGMNQFKDIFLGLVPPPYRRVANSQKCLRVSGKHNDLEEVGKDTYHHTFFEMLGNWSFDDYFKAEAIQWAWELFTKIWGIEADRLWATVFGGDPADNLPRDDEAADLWTKATSISADKVLAFGKKDNFWEMGESGPCGPCSEIHIDLGPDACDMKNVSGHKCRVNGGCARFIELWNLVFIQFNRLPAGKLVPLSAKYVDTGAGLERIVAVLQKKKSNYDTDLFMPIIDATSDVTGHKYTSKLGNKTDNAFRVIADHIRAVSFAVTDGATPSNEGRGYVIRRILRRASRFGRELGMHEPFMSKLVPVVADCLGDAFPEIKQRADYVSTVVESEEASFGRTLDRGIDIFADAADSAAKKSAKTISGEDAFQLYDTYGFPLDLTELMALERGLKVDKAGFEELMEQQRIRARAAQKVDSLTNLLGSVYLSPTDDSLKYKTDTCESTVTNIIDLEDKANIMVGSISAHSTQEYGLVLKETCFYAEMGGQAGDCGIIKSGSGDFIVETTEKLGETVIHWGKVAKGSFTTGARVTASVDRNREDTKKNHTATHLLQWALRQVLGESVMQQGSLVCSEYLRFDFTHPKALTDQDKRRVEYLVREKIAEDLPVTWIVMPKDQAQKLGAMALFGEKYGDDVRVVCIGAEDENQVDRAFSREFCGGTHVDRLGSIGGFKIIKEESISAGVRRITALTGSGLNAHLEKAGGIVDELSIMLKVPADNLIDRVAKLIGDNKRLSKELKTASKTSGSGIMAEAKQLLENCEKIGQSSIIVGQVSKTSAEQAREAIDMLKKKAKSAAIVLGFDDDGKATLIAGVTDDLTKKGLKAGDIIKEIAPIVNGGGGGQPHLAQAGGKSPEKIGGALTKAAELIKQKLAGT
jgi:alanyl-tRNA synthetase